MIIRNPPSSFYYEKAREAARLSLVAATPSEREKLEEAARVWTVLAERTATHEEAARKRNSLPDEGST